jgi:pimeloyl-ACP methyl ester carboxylesterase
MPYADNDGLKIFYEALGEGPPLILLHGLFGSTALWKDAGYVNLLQDDYRLILIDARGHGASDKLYEPEAYKMKEFVSDVIAVMNDIGLEKMHFLGYSMGGWIGFGIMKYAPDRFLSLIIGGAQPYDEWTNAWKPSWNRQLKEDSEKTLEKVARIFEPDVSPDFANILRENDVDAIIALTDLKENLRLDMTMSSLNIPCLLYGGDEDEWSWIGAGERIKVIPNGEYVSLVGGGNHFEAFYKPQLLKPFLDEFLLRVSY